MGNWWDPIGFQFSRIGNALANVVGGGVKTDTTDYNFWGEKADKTYADNPRARAAYEAELKAGAAYRSPEENERVARDRADRWVDDIFSPYTGAVQDFLTGNPIGQALAPTVANGVGVTITPGATAQSPNAQQGPQFSPHLGMQAPPSTPGDFDVEGMVDKAVGTYQTQNGPMIPGAGNNLPGYNQTMAAPPPIDMSKGMFERGLAQRNTPLAPTGFFYNNERVTKEEYDRLTGNGQVLSTEQPETAAGVNRLSDGTEYKTEVVNGKTLTRIIKSPKDPSANGKLVDQANFENILSGKPFTPIGAPSGGIDPTIAGGIGSVVGGAGSIVAGQTAANGATQAGQTAADAANKALELQREQFNQIRQDQQPWRDAGTAALGKLQTFDADNPAFSLDKFQADPGYAFRLSEGMKALQNSAAARGGLMSGNTLKGISNYGQESASQEYQNAYNRYNSERTQRLNNLQGLAGIGQTANNFVGNAAQNYASQGGNAIIGAGNALATGQRNAADANASGYMGASNALINGISSYYNNQTSQNLINALTRGGQ